VPNYELTFIVDSTCLTDDAIDTLYDKYDCFAGGIPHTNEAFVTITVPGADGMEAVRVGTGWLDVAGITVRDLRRELVDAPEIAVRTRKSRQAVHQWISGARREGFPAPFSEASGGIWLWGEVHAWALNLGITVEDPDVVYPTRDEHDMASLQLRSGWSITEEKLHATRVRHIRADRQAIADDAILDRSGQAFGAVFDERLLAATTYRMEGLVESIGKGRAVRRRKDDARA